MKRLYCLTFIFSMLLLIFPIKVSAKEPEKYASKASVEDYLLKAGYSEDVINLMDDDMKNLYYENNYLCESIVNSYGIFTEDYNIEYSIDTASGLIMITGEDLKELNMLLKDQKAVNRIIEGKKSTSAIFPYTVLDKLNNKDNTQYATLTALTNWNAFIVCSDISTNNSVSKKDLAFLWKWTYDPIYTLTDKVALAWSNNYACIPSTARWTYNHQVRYTPSNYSQLISTSGVGYDDYEPNKGVAKNIDIKNAGSNNYNEFHSGTYAVNITKIYTTDEICSAVGNYFHKRISPEFSIGINSSGVGFTVTSGSYVDKSPDSAVVFRYSKTEV